MSRPATRTKSAAVAYPTKRGRTTLVPTVLANRGAERLTFMSISACTTSTACSEPTLAAPKSSSLLLISSRAGNVAWHCVGRYSSLQLPATCLSHHYSLSLCCGIATFLACSFYVVAASIKSGYADGFSVRSLQVPLHETESPSLAIYATALLLWKRSSRLQTSSEAAFACQPTWCPLLTALLAASQQLLRMSKAK
jgi:hypothetical protein